MFEKIFAREMEEGRGRPSGHGRHCGEKHFRGRHGDGGDFGSRNFGGPPWGGRLRGRFFDSGDLRFVILRLIAEKPGYGYEIIKAIEERLSGVYSPSPGVVYPTLTLLEELGYVTVSQGEGTKKLHTITAEGLAALEANKTVVDALFERMKRTGEAFDRGRATEIMRAIENLRMVLRLKTSLGQMSEEQIRRIVDTIDGAAKQIEQS